jgi:hypothetical protein
MVMGGIRVDPRARQILFDTFWSPAGWKRERSTPSADLEYAIAAGYMFPSRSAETHQRQVERAIEARDGVSLADAASAFVASLGSRALAQRSALGSLASIRHLSPHPVRPPTHHCGDCGAGEDRVLDLDAFSFERQKWGGVRHGDVGYAAFDLELFGRSDQVEGSDGDAAILNAILDAARTSEADDRPRDLEQRIAPLFPSNKAEREVVLAILAACGVFASSDHPGLMDVWVPIVDREPPPKPSKNDWQYPMFWWRGSLGVNEQAARNVFGTWVR